MERRRRGPYLVLAGVALLLTVFAVGLLTAPSLAVDSTGERTTLVGSQSTEGGWHEGGAVMLFQDDVEQWHEDSAVNYFDATMMDDGRVVAGFSDVGYQSGCDPYDPPCSKTGYRIIDPDAEGGPTVVDEWSFPIRSAGNSEVHDVEVLPGGGFVLADMEHERLVEVQDGEITWQWNASEVYNPPEDPTRQDWLHMNDVDRINETHFLVSVRNANQLLVVSRDNGVVEIINEDRGGSDSTCSGQLVADEDGDVRCGDPDVINHQHNPQWIDEGAVLVADSDNDRVVELHENESTGQWEPAWSAGEAAGASFDWPRDADRLENGNTLVTDTFNSRVVEITPNGTAVWTAQLYNLPYEADRLPQGELAGAQRYTAGGDIVEPSGEGIPVLTLLVESMKGEFPIIPFWFSEFHLAVSIIALLLVLAGVVDRSWVFYRDWKAQQTAPADD